MKRYHVMNDAQMQRLIEAPANQKGDDEQKGGAIDIDAELRLPRVHQLNRDIESVLKSGDASLFSRFKALKDELQSLYSWFKDREAKPPAQEAFVPPPPVARYKEPFMPKPATKRKRKAKDAGLRVKTKYVRVSRNREPVVGEKAEAPKRKRKADDADQQKKAKQVRLSPFEVVPDEAEVTTPRRTRSLGPPRQWHTVNTAREKYPAMRRL